MPKPTESEVLAAALEVSPELRERIRLGVAALEAKRTPLTVRGLREVTNAGTKPVSALLKAYRAKLIPSPAESVSWRELKPARAGVPRSCAAHDRELGDWVEQLVEAANEILLGAGCETIYMIERVDAGRICRSPRAHSQ